MVDDSQKRNTDCVYFLASPLTCKKGSGCEYRHSENARFNPRDCWYWLSGNCLNPACSFRHPPLDGRPEISSESVHLSPHLSVASTKTNLPCYFFFNAYCKKGDTCPFLHEPDKVSSGWKSTKTVSAGTGILPSENKASTESYTRPMSAEGAQNPSHRMSGDVNLQLGPKDVQLETLNSVNHSPSPQSAPNCKVAVVKMLDITPPMVNFIDYTKYDQSSEEEKSNNYAEPEEQWESSPGFDVLVGDGSEHFDYEDDAEYPGVHGGETGGLHDHLIQHNYDDPSGYDPTDYPHAGMYEHGIHDLCDHLDNYYPGDYGRRVPDHVRERVLEQMIFRKWKLLPVDIDYHSGVDLRDHLKNSNRNNHHGFHGSKKRRLTFFSDDSREQTMRGGWSHMLHGRLASEMGKSRSLSPRESDFGLRGSNRSGLLARMHSRLSRRKLKERSRRQVRLPSLSSEISRGDTKPIQESTAFTGPKTLAQIKEEKRRASMGDGDPRNARSSSIHQKSSRAICGNSPASEPLSKLGKSESLRSVVLNPSQSTGRNSEHDHGHLSFTWLESDRGQLDEYAKTGHTESNGMQFQENDDCDDDVYDDDELEKELAEILN